MKKYDKNDAKAILGHLIDGLIEERDDGFWPISTGDKVLQWKPCFELDEPNAPHLRKTPSLPYLFTANDLAAFMLFGAGLFLLEEYGDWSKGPDEEVLEEMDDEDETAKEALREAYAVYVAVEIVVGRLDKTIHAQYQLLVNEYLQRENEASEVEKTIGSGISLAELDERKAVALQQSDEALAAWRKAMVNELLRPEPPAAPVVTVGDGSAKSRAKKPSIETVALDYMREVYRVGQFASAAKFHKHLCKNTESKESPFEMGTGENGRKLFCPGAASFFDAGTLGKMWPKIRSA